MIRTIAFDARLWRSSGIGTYIRNVIPRLADLRTSTTFHLFGEGAPGPPDWAAAPNVRWVEATAPIYSLREQFEIPRRLAPETDILWSPHYNIPLLGRVPRVVTIQDLLHLARPEYVRGLHRRAYARTIFQATRRAAALIFTSRFTAGEYMRLVGAGRGQAEVIPLGVSPEWFGAAAPVGASGRPYFLFVGNVKPHKNLRGLLAAFAQIRDRLPHDLLIVGRREGFIHGDSDAQRAARDFGDRVRFTGWIDDADLRARVAGAEALVIPSLYEGFGLPPLEAMAAGCPAIVSNAASLPEVCGNSALYCEPDRPGTIAEAMLRVATDAELRSELIAAGREHARTFTWDRCARETAALLDSLT